MNNSTQVAIVVNDIEPFKYTFEEKKRIFYTCL